MARVRLSPLLANVSGSIGTVTFQGSQGGNVVRAKPRLKDSLSKSRQLVKSRISRLIAIWQGFTANERIQWERYASYSMQLMNHASKKYLSGYNVFVRYNQIRLNAGLDVLPSPSFFSSEPCELTASVKVDGENFFVAVGQGTNTIAWSNDGVNWTGLGTSIFSSFGYSVCWNGEIFVAGGFGTNSLAWSSDGKIWTGLGTEVFSSNCNCICWNGAIFVAVGYGGHTLAYSYDGLNWTGLRNIVFDAGGHTVCWNGKIFVAGGIGSSALAWSSDGINWNALGHPVHSTYCRALCWGKNMFLSVGEGGYTMGVSWDGKLWFPVATSPMVGAGYAICWNGKIFVAGGSNPVSMAWSNDGLNWTSLGIDTFSYACYSIRWNGNIFVAGGRFANTIAYSYDGKVWVGLGKTIFSAYGYGVCSKNAPSLIPHVFYQTYLQLGADLSASDQFVSVQISLPCRSSVKFNASKCRVIVLDSGESDPYSVGQQYYSVFGHVLKAGQVVMLSIQIFLINTGRVFNRSTNVLTVEDL